MYYYPRPNWDYTKMTGLGHSHTEDEQSVVYLTEAEAEAQTQSNAVSVTCCSSFHVMPEEDHHEGGPKQGSGRVGHSSG
ncbi:uncharacterized protein TrAtP1_008692 [Trichoderma atroviride]|uniref:uncharacterized protein n=1 Tax=Hypocrea atroviridis TaxID=63577 RepID=UPI00331EA46C|nr:hypothetical protein TrAtP1_008692 [Trichoderma atroviride]